MKKRVQVGEKTEACHTESSCRMLDDTKESQCTHLTRTKANNLNYNSMFALAVYKPGKNTFKLEEQ